MLKRARTRFHVELADRTVVTAPFALVFPAAAGEPDDLGLCS